MVQANKCDALTNLPWVPDRDRCHREGWKYSAFLIKKITCRENITTSCQWTKLRVFPPPRGREANNITICTTGPQPTRNKKIMMLMRKLCRFWCLIKHPQVILAYEFTQMDRLQLLGCWNLYTVSRRAVSSIYKLQNRSTNTCPCCWHHQPEINTRHASWPPYIYCHSLAGD